jgi:hypothetical protein
MKTKKKMNVLPLTYAAVCAHLPACLADVSVAFVMAKNRTREAIGLAGEAENADRSDDFLRGAALGGHLFLVSTKRGHIFYERNWVCNVFRAACLAGQLGVVRYAISRIRRSMLLRFVLTSEEDFWDEALKIACCGGHIAVAKLMIANGARNFGDGLVEACSRGHANIAKMMLVHGARNVNSAYREALRAGQYALAKLMMKHGASNHYCKEDLNEAFLDHCFAGEVDMAQALIDLGADEFDRGLRIACRNGNRNIAQLMLQHGATKRYRALAKACEHGHTEIATMLLPHCENISWVALREQKN